MPGRPKHHAKMMGSVELLASEVMAMIFAETPKQYQKFIGARKPLHPTELGQAWQAANHYAMSCMVAVERLGNMLRRRAGMKGPSVSESYLCDDDFPFVVQIRRKETPPEITQPEISTPARARDLATCDDNDNDSTPTNDGG